MELNHQLSALKAFHNEDLHFRQALLWLRDIQASPHCTQESHPIFVLSAGWCSGAIEIQHMLQRHCLMWGEPYGQGNLLQPIKRQCIALHQQATSHGLENHETASAWIEAHAMFFLNLFERPASEAGALHWGLTEVRWNIFDALYLQWLFPKAKFLLLIRNPYDAFREYFECRQIWEVYPGISLTVSAFGKHWTRLAQEYLTQAKELGALVLRHESFEEPSTLEAISTYLNTDQCVPCERRPKKVERHMPISHWTELERHVGPVAREWGYEPPQDSRSIGIGKQGRVAQHNLANTAKSEDYNHDNARCKILVRVRDYIEPMCEEALRVLESRGYIVKRIYGFSAIDVGRSIMAYESLTEGFEELFWIDSRVLFHPNAVDQLRDHQLPLVGAAVPKTKSPGFEVDFKPEPTSVAFGEEGGLVEVQRTSCSFLYTHSSVYETMHQKLAMKLCNQQMSNGLGFLPFFQPMILPKTSPPSYLADDFAFTERAQQCGISIYIDTSIRIGHIGAYPYMWEDIQTPRTFTNSFHWNLGSNGQSK